jgi:hypothetical protein
MPFQCTIDHSARRVTVTATGRADAGQMTALLNKVAVAGAMPYRKLLDITQADLGLDPAVLTALGAAIRKYAATRQGSLGPTAIVVASDEGHRRATIFGQAAKANRPFRIFHEVRDARQWLDSFPP